MTTNEVPNRTITEAEAAALIERNRAEEAAAVARVRRIRARKAVQA